MELLVVLQEAGRLVLEAAVAQGGFLIRKWE